MLYFLSALPWLQRQAEINGSRLADVSDCEEATKALTLNAATPQHQKAHTGDDGCHQGKPW
jgi:hypothetical protein